MARVSKQRGPRETLRPPAAQPTPQQERRGRGRQAWRLLAIWALLVLAYSNSFQAGLVFDDHSILEQDPRIREASVQNLASILTGGYRYGSTTAGLYRPLTTLSFLMNYAGFGDGSDPRGYHCVNLALHAINVALVYALGLTILKEATPAWGLAAIWGLHPLLTESVTNIVGRADLLAGFGVLAGLLCYVRAASAAGRKRLAWIAGIAAAQMVGMFSKESAAVLPGIMLLYDLTLQRTVWRRRAPAYAVLLLPFGAFLYLRSQAHVHMVIPFADNPLVSAGFWTARLTALDVIGRYVWLFVWPARLSADYSYNAVPLFGWHDVSALAALAICAASALLAVTLAVRGTRKQALFFLGFFFVAMAPTSNLIVPIGSIMAERFLYLPSAGLAGCIAAAMCGLKPRSARLAGAAFGLVCVALAGHTYARNFDWQDELTLWSSTVEVNPGSAKAHYNLGKALEAVPGRLPAAIAEYRESVRIDPAHADVHNNLANAVSNIPGGLPEAIAEYEAAVRIQPDRAEPHNNLAIALARIPGRLPEAITEYRAALRITPDDAEIHYNLANALVSIPGSLAEAIEEYRAALRVNPDHADAHTNLGNALARVPGRVSEAIAEYRTALRLEPGSVGAHMGLANALAALAGGLPEAIANYEEALRVQPGNAEAHYDLGTALARMPGRLPEAIAEFQAALRTEPNLMEAHVNLANALAQTGRLTEAIAEYEAAIRITPDPEVREMLDRLRARAR